jgi:hypothetical protein
LNRYEILLEYNSAIRKLVNSKVGKTEGIRNPSESTLRWIKRQFRFNKEEDWGLLCASMILVEDTSLAIQNFERFKLEGPTKYEDLGEKYLRLYGLLNAIYLQQWAVQRMYGVFQVPRLGVLKAEIQALRITELRHKLASHTLNYRDIRAGKVDWFVVSQNDLAGTKAAFMSFLTDQYEKVDLLELVQQHLELMTASLDKVFEKAINTVYKTSQEKHKAFLEELKLLRAQVSGDIVVSLPEQGKVLRFGPANKKKSNKQRV